MAVITGNAVGGAVLDPLMGGIGLKAANINPIATASAQLAPTSQIVYLNAIWIPPGTVCTNIVLQPITASSGTVTGLYVGLATTAGVMVAQSSNLGASSPFTTANALTAAALSATYTTNSADSANGVYYVVQLQNGAFSVTNPAYGRSGANFGRLGSNAYLSATGVTTGQTAPPANGASIAGGLTTSNAVGFFVAVS